MHDLGDGLFLVRLYFDSGSEDLFIVYEDPVGIGVEECIVVDSNRIYECGLFSAQVHAPQCDAQEQIKFVGFIRRVRSFNQWNKVTTNCYSCSEYISLIFTGFFVFGCVKLFSSISHFTSYPA